MMSSEDYKLRKRVNELKNREKRSKNRMEENDELIIEKNTIYEVDLECYDCMMKKMKR